MSKRPPIINYTQMFYIPDTEGQYAAYIERQFRHGVWWVNILVKAPYRKQGYALALTRQALAHWGSDELWVRVSGFQDQPFTDEQLTRIYRRFGFQPTGTPGTMRRPPDEL